MAIKDWKKVGKDLWIVKKYPNKDNVVKLRIDYLPGKSNYKYEVYAIGKYTSNTISSFKSKSHALKFAKGYMGKH